MEIMAEVAKAAPSEATEASVRTYLTYAGKGFMDMNAFDNILIRLAQKSPLARMDPAKAEWFTKWFAANSGKLAKAGKAAKVLGNVAMVFYIGHEVSTTVPKAMEAYENGDRGEAVGIIAGKATEVATTLAAGGFLTSQIAMYLAPACAVAAGPFAPLGAAVGILVSAVVGYGVAAFIGSGLGDVVKRLVTKAVDSVIAFMKSGAIEAFCGSIASLAQDICDTALDIAVPAIEQIKAWAADLAAQEAEDERVRQEQAEAMCGLVKDTLDDAMTFMSNMAGSAAFFFSGAAEAVAAKVSIAADDAAAAAQDLLEEIAAEVEGIASHTKEVLDSVWDKLSEMVDGIWRDLSTIVNGFALRQPDTWEKEIDAPVDEVRSLADGFITVIRRLMGASVVEASAAFHGFGIKAIMLSSFGGVNLKPWSEFASDTASRANDRYSVSRNSGKIAVNLADLRKVKLLAEDMHREITMRVKITEKVRAVANNAMKNHSQSYVWASARAVLAKCDELESATRRAADSLLAMSRGLGIAIERYAKLEYDWE
jgi:hypothetical protein